MYSRRLARVRQALRVELVNEQLDATRLELAACCRYGLPSSAAHSLYALEAF
jgi:hypothetical protein